MGTASNNSYVSGGLGLTISTIWIPFYASRVILDLANIEKPSSVMDS